MSVFLFSCQDENVTPITQVNNIDSTIVPILNCITNNDTIDFHNITFQVNGNHYKIIGCDNNDTLSISLHTLIESTFIIEDNLPHQFHAVYNNYTAFYGVLTISENDTINKIISGTFIFSANNVYLEYIGVKGTFKNINY